MNNRWPGHETIAADPRNVIDHYKYWDTEAIKADLDLRRSDLVVVLENFAGDFNIGSAVRNANAFLAREVVIVGRRNWDRRGATGSHHYEHISHAADVREVTAPLRDQDYRIVAVDNLPQAEAVTEYTFAAKTCLIFGQESIGISPEALEEADDLIYIPQYGSTRSLNVGVASGIVMHEYMRRFGQHRPPLESES